ncbi:tetratricopeptide repeat protein [Hymenobacter gummosus]|uniref:Tetratricopeptide repeat protein n=1 Tax=Hymenobacter gummosus TaxID=1776032 RepID=A0A431U267_9BACT|nr:toxin-antitoxin system YwqK family antitoxin [Hymenobacter gummosus]RTQ49312.1 tetratricopeptide repeat protein [Hymenobacter gummosus]
MPHRYAGSTLLLSLLALSAAAQPSAAPVPATAFRPASGPANELPLVGREALRQGIALHDKNEYGSAIATYLRVAPSDSAYADVQGELALSYWANEQYAEAAVAAQRALDLGMRSPSPYAALANSLEELKQVDKALATFQTGLKRYPYAGSLWFNQAVTLAGQTDKTAAAAASYQRGLELRPLHASSHLQLAHLELNQGHPAHALLGLVTSLMLEPEGGRSKSTLLTAEQLSMGSLEVADKDKRASTTPNDAFAELDQLLTARVALRKDYRSPVNFQAAVVKQTQLLVEKFPLAKDEASADFWQRTYGPVVEMLRQGDNLTTFTYLILCSADDPKAGKWVKGNLPKVRKLLTDGHNKLALLRDFQMVERNGKPTRVEAWFYDSGELSGLGDARRDAAGKPMNEGFWQYYDEQGNPAAEGSYAAGEKTGPWRYFNPDGTLLRESSYERGKLSGSYRQYYDSGKLEIEATYRNGEPTGLAKIYHPCGALREERRYNDAGQMEGAFVRYYSNGQVEERGTYRLDKTEGLVSGFYSDGTPEGDATMSGGQMSGEAVTYFGGPGKRVERRAQRLNGELHGLCTDYFPNGQVRETGTFSKGKRTGQWKTYYADGKLSMENNYDKDGKLHGTFRDYDVDGVLFCEISYEHDRARKSVYFDKQGKPLQQNTVGNADANVRGLRPDGTPYYSGAYRQGLMHGEWTYVYRHGQPSERRRYLNDQQDGVQETYHPNGKVKTRTTYVAGEKHGRFEQYAADGVLRQDGWFVHGQAHGQWREYYPDGSLSEEYGFYQGDRNGLNRTYSPTGKLTGEVWTKATLPTHIIEYDSVGRALADVQLKPDADGYVLNYPSGKPRLRIKLNCGLYTGNEWYFPSGQVQTTVPMRNGQRDGAYRRYLASGKLATEGSYLNDEEVGEWKYYHADGQLQRKGSFESGNRQGEWTTYHPNGQVASRETYRDGDLHGDVRTFDEAGQLVYEKRYHLGTIMAWRHLQPNGQPGPWQDLSSQNGTVKSYFANGKLAAEETYRNGVFDGTCRVYHSTGQLAREWTLRDGLDVGVHRRYSATGQLLAEESYQHDELHGLSRYFRPDGTLQSAESWRNGEMSGPTVYYNAQGKPEHTDIYWNNYVYGSK